ncbi:hypothetical protein SNE40_020281 [Patella caerulea]|uniref:Uncharacterized protein n=1 Tax=Patella caerulea TaxID=87958 RepID=A0AAN8G2I7_PATCE
MNCVSRLFGLTILYSLFITHGILATSTDDLSRLHDHLTKRNPRKLRPVVNTSEPLFVYIDFYLLKIIELDEVKQNLHISVIFNISWKDELLTWTEEEFGGIKSYVPTNDILWLPALSCFKYAVKMNIFEDNWYGARVYSDGQVVWRVQKSLNFICGLNMQYFPNDDQSCPLLFYTLGYYSGEVVLVSNSQEADYKLFNFDNGEWKLNGIDLFTELYQTDATFWVVLFKVHIKLYRLHIFYFLNMIIPILMLSFLNLFTFCLPDSCGEKISFSLTVLLSETVFLSTIRESLPASSLNIAYIALYMTGLLVISCLISIASIVLLYVRHHRKEKPSIKEPRNETRVPDVFKSAKISPLPSEHSPNDKTRSCCAGFSCSLDMILFLIFFSAWALTTTVFIAIIMNKG